MRRLRLSEPPLALRKKDRKTLFHSRRGGSQFLKGLYALLHHGYLLEPAASTFRADSASALVLAREEARKVVAPDAMTPLGCATGHPGDPLRHRRPAGGEPRRPRRLRDVDAERVVRVLLGKGRKDRNIPVTRPAAER